MIMHPPERICGHRASMACQLDIIFSETDALLRAAAAKNDKPYSVSS
jgi:hypothetical protein